MEHKIDVKTLNNKIQLMKNISEDILKEAETFPSLYRNCRKILANIKMLEINVSDIQEYF